MRNRIFAVLAVAILAGGGLALATYNAMNKGNNPAVQATKTQPVVVANTDLSLGAELKLEDLKVSHFPDGQTRSSAAASSSASSRTSRSCRPSWPRRKPVRVCRR